MFKPVPQKPNFPELEERILKFWEEDDCFRKLMAQNRGRKRFSFLDGPITANNPMGVHHAWGRTYKDLFQRYRAMLGYDQRYQNGFDCQGLWVEVEVERELGFNSKREIEQFGIDRFVECCKARVLKYAKIQTQQSIRLGQWMDWENSYYTMSDENNYSIWHFLKRCWEAGWIYKGHDVMPWCPRCGTALSEHEIVTEGYRELTHPGLYLKLPILGRIGEHLLVWTTTPWTLTANTAVAVHPTLPYIRVAQGGRIYWVAQERCQVLTGEYKILSQVPGKELVGLGYRPPFEELPAQEGVEHRVISWPGVSGAEGTGIVHIAPGCGREDFALSKEQSIAVIAPIDENGVFLEGFGPFTGRKVGDVTTPIIEALRDKGYLYKVEEYTHRYPVCWRCGSELVFRLVDEWFIRMDELRHRIAQVAKEVRWIPEFGLERELDWLRNMEDWCISKKRYWGLALPIYECSCGTFEVLGGREELRTRAVKGWEEFENHSPHRPWVDLVKIRCPRCGSEVSRIPDVANPWLDAGIVPFSTLNYLSNRAYWESWFPADFIVECFPGQFRNWFYAILAMSTVLENRAPCRTILGYALVKDEHGEEMHKSRGNVIWFDEAVERMGADVMRWIFLTQNPVQNLHFGYRLGYETTRKLLTLWNVYNFFVTYARIDKYDPKSSPRLEEVELSPLDRWALSRLIGVIGEVRVRLDDYDPARATRAISEFIEDLSLWYVRRSRRRFWKSTQDTDKLAAYSTLYRCLVDLTRLLAPFMPFLAEEFYQNLVRSVDPASPESVHLTSYPEVEERFRDPTLEAQMELVRRLVSLGRSARERAGLKVRQPLEWARLVLRPEELHWIEEFEPLIKDELNLKAIEYGRELSELVRYRAKPKLDRLGPKFGARLPKLDRALTEIEEERLAASLKGAPLRLQVDGEEIELGPDEVEVVVEEVPGYRVVTDGDYGVAIKVQLTPELISEGLARELVHRIQTLRKEAGFEVTDRIRLTYEGSAEIEAVIEEYKTYIAQETLALEVSKGLSPGEIFRELKLDQGRIRLSLGRIGR